MADAALGAGLGAAKYWGIQRPQENRQRNMAANTAYYQGVQGKDPSDMIAAVGGMPKEGSVWNNMAQGAGAGMQMGGAGMGGGSPMAGAQDISGGGSAGGMAGGPMDAMGGAGGVSQWAPMMGGGIPMIPA